jgi:hypothetical protein
VTTSHLPRRAVVGAALAASLIGTGLVAAFAADPPPCTTFTDPKGDSAPADAPFLPAGEDDLDITGVTFEAADSNLSVSIYVAALNVAPEYSFGDEFQTAFKHGGKLVELYAYRYNPTDMGTLAEQFYDQTGMDVDGEAAATTMKVTYDEKASRVTFSLPLAELEKATSTPTTGALLTELAAQSSGDDLAVGERWDDAAAPKDTTYAIGSACGGGAAPVAAAPSATPEASASPSPAASPDPSASPTPTSASPVSGGAAPAAAGMPTADCFAAKDPKGDASVGVINGAPGLPNDPDLDISGLTVGTAGPNLVAYFKVDKLDVGPASTDGHRFTVNFTFNKHTFALAGSAYANAENGQVRDGLASTGQFSHVTQLSVDGKSLTDPAGRTAPGFVDSGLKYTFDVKNSYVIASLPLADIEKHGKAPVAGATFTGLYAISAADTDAVSNQADVVPDGSTASAPGKLTYAVGDNHCFAAPTPPLSSVGAVKAQYGDVAAVAAKLADGAGAPLAGKTLTFSLGAAKATGLTGADGVAKAALTVKDKAGKRSLKVTGEGASISVPFTVLVEKTALKVTGSKGTIAATLSDDDKKPVVGQALTFTAGSKKATVKTDAKGVAKVAGFAPGAAVKVTYAGAAGMYAAANGSAKA